MHAVNMLKAESSLFSLVEAIEQDREREIIITRNGRPAATLAGCDNYAKCDPFFPGVTQDSQPRS